MTLPRVRILRVRPGKSSFIEGDVIGCVALAQDQGKCILVVGCDDGKVELRYTEAVEYLPEDEG